MTYFFFPLRGDLALGKAAQKADINLSAIKIVQRLEKEQRDPTPDEQDVLSNYTGWGDSKVFDHGMEELEQLVSEKEYRSIKASTLNAHFTALPIIRAIWSGVVHLGADKLTSLHALDPAAGVGHFFSLLPEVLREKSHLVEIELDHLTARILKYLHPNQEGRSATFNDGFQSVPLNAGQFDLVISNVPFGNYPVVDPSIKEHFLKSCIHDYFFAKAVSMTRPGGVIAFITSRYTLDKKKKNFREWLARRADLLCAVRLPNTTFLSNAGTEVVTDIVFLQKRLDLLEGDLPSWVDTQEAKLESGYIENHHERDGKAHQNLIYSEHPDWIIGKVEFKHGQYNNFQYTVKYDGSEQIADLVVEILEDALPEDVLLTENKKPAAIETVLDTLTETHVIEIHKDAPVDQVRRLEILRDIYDAAQTLLNMEVSGRKGVEGQRSILNTVYDSFVSRFGPITNSLNQKLLKDSPARPFLLALETDYVPLTNSADKAPIFHTSTIRSARQPEKIDSCVDAFLYSLDKTGGVDIDWIASLAKVSVEQAVSELAAKILWTPDGHWEIAEKYLSGNLLEKLSRLNTMVTIDPRLKETIRVVKEALPPPLKPEEIKARLGSGWIPADIIEEYIEHILPGTSPQVTHIPKVGMWKVTPNKYHLPAENTTKWGTPRAPAFDLLEYGLNAQTPVIYDEDEAGKRHLNREQTIAAQAKLEELKADFVTWLWMDEERAKALAIIYNEKFNGFVRPTYDGSHLSFPGLSLEVTPRQLQKDAVWYALQRSGTLVGDEVGAGKTLTAILSVMESIRLGFAHKAMFVVPNHLTEQWFAEIIAAYPNAKVLCIGKDEMSKANRSHYMSRIATHNWDAVIVPQSSFKLLPLKPETLAEFVEAELEELKSFLIELKSEERRDRRAEKEIEKAIKRFEAKLAEKADMAKDSADTITWEQLGIDMLVVDEFHYYKNLFFHTKMTRVAGLPNANSQRAFDMFIKIRLLLQNDCRFIGLTGTPLTNTLAEVFTLQRYFQFDLLDRIGLSHFDSWVQMFADTVMVPEMTPDGGGFRVNTRLARFTNIPELSGMMAQFMIMRRWDDISDQVVRPVFYGGKPVPVQMPGSKALKGFVKTLSDRYEKVKAGGVDPREDNVLKIMSEGRKAALDMRLLFPNAYDLGASKINTASWIISELYHRTEPHKSAQLVFCDLGTPKPYQDSRSLKDSEDGTDLTRAQEDEPEFNNVYADLKAKLVRRGVRGSEIAFIHDVKKPADRARLFENIRRGNIRVLIGSTEKMGTGMNVQTRAIAMHHLDAPWRPADIEQRDGRVLRQGNIYSEVFSFVYITEGSFDGYVWQILETKARFIEQFLKGNTGTREMDDVGDTVLSMAELKALASGNPKIVERVLVQSEIMKLENLRSAWQSGRWDTQRRFSMNTTELKETRTRVGFLNKALDLHTKASPDDKFAMEVEGNLFTERRPAGAALIEAARILKLEAERTGREARKKTGEYRGFAVWLRAIPNSERSMNSLMSEVGVDILLDYNVPQVLVARVSDSDTGTIASIDATIRSVEGEIKKNVERIEYLETQVRKFESILSEEWEHAEKLAALVVKLNLMDQELIKDGEKTGDADSPTDEEADGIEEITTAPVTMETQAEPDWDVRLAEDAVVNFNLDEILEHVGVLIASTVPPDASPIAVQSVESEPEAVFPVSVSSQKQLPIDEVIKGGQIHQSVQKPSKSKVRKKDAVPEDTVQLTFF